MLNNVTGLLAHTRVDPPVDVGCTWLPLYHDMGLSFLLSGALSGAGQWLAPTAAFSASPFRWLHWLSESRASMTAAPNFAYTVLAGMRAGFPMSTSAHCGSPSTAASLSTVTALRHS